MSAKRFRVAFSFAGETKRDFVANVARILARRFGEGAILYDKYHRAEFSRSDLAFYLPDLYAKEADLVVAVFCPDYENKEWCGLEWNAIFGLLKARKASEVMLTRFERVEGKGLHGLAGYTDLDDLTPEQAADGILERLAVNEGRPKDHYKDKDGDKHPHTSIPNNLPRLQPFYGRERELAAIREALDPESRTWGALIDGPGGMGKTSLAVRAAYDCSPGQFQRIIFVSLKNRELEDDGERELGGFILSGLLEMLNELARELGQPDIAKAPEDQRIRLLLDALRPAQVLLILDNLESLARGDRDQLLTFVKRLPQGCKAILTSRRRIGSGSELLILEQLDQAAALETLADLARHNPLLARTTEAERIALYEHAVSVESEAVAVALNNLADAERLSGDLSAAERDYREALRVARAVGSAEGMDTSTSNLAELTLDQGNWPRAESLAREALPLSEKLGHQNSIASACDVIARALVKQSRVAEGLPYARRAVDIYTRLRSPRLEAATATLRKCES